MDQYVAKVTVSPKRNKWWLQKCVASSQNCEVAACGPDLFSVGPVTVLRMLQQA